MTKPGQMHVLDVRGLRCVQVLLRLRRQIERLAPDAAVYVVTDDPAASLDLPAWCHLTGHHFLGPVATPLGTAYGIGVAAGATGVDSRQPWVTRP